MLDYVKKEPVYKNKQALFKYKSTNVRHAF